MGERRQSQREGTADGRRDREGSLGEVEVSDPVETSAPTGTVTTVDGISETPAGLVDDATIDKITATFALHLDKYPDPTRRGRKGYRPFRA